MSTTTVSALRHRMIEDMSLRNLAPARRSPTSVVAKGWQRSCAVRPTRPLPKTFGSFSCISPNRE
jgi:hypothetical protein